MRKLLAFLVCIFFITVLVLSSWNTGMQWVTKDRYARKDAWGSDKYMFGDLYGLSYIKEFKKLIDTHDVALPSLPAATLEKNINLTILGDSYFYSSFESNSRYFPKVKNFNFVSWSTQNPIQLTPIKNQNNVLLIEVVERNMGRLLQLKEVGARLDLHEFIRKRNQEGLAPIGFKNWFKWENARVSKFLYHPTQEANLDFILFNVIHFSPFKEWKATLNYHVFGRTAPEVQVSKKGDFLYLSESTKADQIGSSFVKLDAQRLNQIVSNMNEIDAYYKNKGFQHVIFSIIPNPVGLLNTEGIPTNQLIDRIEMHPNLRTVVINPSRNLRVQAHLNFYTSDSHWNQRGAKIWLDLVNAHLKNL